MGVNATAGVPEPSRLRPAGSEAGRLADFASTAPVRVRRDDVTVALPATCGELGQGMLDGQDFLINCPIGLFAEARARDGGFAGFRLEACVPTGSIRRALDALADQLGLAPQDRLSLSSPIPRGIGMASRAAVLGAALLATCERHQVNLAPAAFARLAAALEPSACVHYPGIAEVHHPSGTLLNHWEAPAGLAVIVIDCGEIAGAPRVDRRRARALYAEARDEVLGMRALLRYGLGTGDLEAIGRGATLSARLGQRIRPKPPFEDLWALASSLGAVGINCAHAGSVLGILHRASRRDADRLIDAIDRRFDGEVSILGSFGVIDGGPRRRGRLDG